MLRQSCHETVFAPESQAWTGRDGCTAFEARWLTASCAVMKQSCFFTASAPLHGKHINVSPKGLPSTSFSILNPNLVGYVDATGSGIETVSHIQENGRCTIMLCSFGASPRIMRLFCKGRVIPWNHPDFNSWRKRMGDKHFEGMRAVILLDVWKVCQLRIFVCVFFISHSL